MERIRNMCSVPVLFVWMLQVCAVLCDDSRCVHIVFLDHNSTSPVITEMENSNITLGFEIRELTSGCFNSTSTLSVSVRDLSTSNSPLCHLIYSKGKFFGQGETYKTCQPTADDNVYNFVKTVNRTQGNITWTSNWNGSTTMATVRFNITYPPVIEKFAFSRGDTGVPADEPVAQNTDLLTQCKWVDGNPQHGGHLLDRHGRQLNPTASGANFAKYRKKVGCDDAGTFVCVVGDVRLSKTLLVQCPPDIQAGNRTEWTFRAGDDAELQFSVRTHTTIIKSCTMSQPGNITAGPLDCLSYSNLTGTPPDLVLTVRLDNVRKQDEGQWRLTLTNDVGTGQYFDFSVEVIEQPDTNSLKAGSAPLVIVGGVVVAGAVVIFVIVAVVVVRRTRSKKAVDMIVNDVYGGKDDCVMVTNDVYGGSGGKPVMSGSAYEEVETRGPLPGQPSTSGGGAMRSQNAAEESEYAEVDAASKPHKAKAKAKDKKKPKQSISTDDQAANGGDMYVDVAEIKKKKGKAKQPATSGQGAEAAQGDLYVGMDHIRERKRQKGAANGTTQDAAGSNSGVSVNADGLTYVQLDFGDKPVNDAIIAKRESTEYAEIDLKGVPARPPK